jgi:hypothetical protein
VESIVDDWSVMTDEEKKRVLQMIFNEIWADHTVDGLRIEFRPKPIWEPYVEAVASAGGLTGLGRSPDSSRIRSI